MRAAQPRLFDAMSGGHKAHHEAQCVVNFTSIVLVCGSSSSPSSATDFTVATMAKKRSASNKATTAAKKARVDEDFAGEAGEAGEAGIDAGFGALFNSLPAEMRALLTEPGNGETILSESTYNPDDPVSVKGWDGHYALLRKYKEEFGNCRVPKSYKSYGKFNLGNWMSDQRDLNKKSNLSEERKNKLNEIGMIWDASKERPAVPRPAEVRDRKRARDRGVSAGVQNFICVARTA